MNDIKEYILQQTGINISNSMESAFSVYCDFLLQENEKYNLTAITDPAAVWVKHFADSLLACEFIPQNAMLCDVGSGAGFPAIPLKIAREDIAVTLVDSLEKRVNFQKMLCEKLAIFAECIHSRAEDFAKTHSELYDVATARAVAPLSIVLEYTAQIVKLGGTVIAYKTDTTELATAQTACSTLGLTFKTSKCFVLPDGSSRAILVFEKTSHTPPKYPRGQNKPRKQPL